MIMSTIGRKKEKEEFKDFMNSGRSVVYGRRRVGKTYLIKQYF
jgi:AAA+ ATPase superfamily predicted ATPase